MKNKITIGIGAIIISMIFAGIASAMMGPADFDGDGKSDVIWRNYETGALSVWLMNGTGNDKGSPGTVKLPWKIRHIIDFDGDLKSDILWRDYESGKVSLWLMDGKSKKAGGSLGEVGLSWNIEGVVDFNGDSKADILWRNHETGTISIWLMDGLNTDKGSPGTIDLAWKLELIGDFDGDGKADILWRNHETWKVSVWLMEGYSKKESGSLGKVANQWGQQFTQGEVQETWYKDMDHDKYSDGTFQTTRERPDDHYLAVELLAINGDCDDSDPNKNPGEEDPSGDGIDTNCDGVDGIKNIDLPSNSLGMTFTPIPAGTFMMGSPDSELGRGSDETLHEVQLTGFFMQTTEVTQGQWNAVMGSNPSSFSNCGGDCPVDSISWDDAQGFINALNQMNEGTYRLPTEAEWEYAARAGSNTALANGDITVIECDFDTNLDAMGWYCGNAGDTTHPVAQKNANVWGLYDMHGNVYEWCQDWYGTYPSTVVIDPVGPVSGSSRVLRGGSWNYDANYCRSAYRDSISPDYRSRYGGLRLVLSPSQQ